MNILLCQSCGLPLSKSQSGQMCPACLLHEALNPVYAKDDGVRVTQVFPWRFGDYELLGELGCGGMGIVFYARQLSLDRMVAVKTPVAGAFVDGDTRRRFQAEVEAAAHLQHPNIVAIYEVGEFEGQPFFTMELVDGPDLATLCNGRPISTQLAAEYLRDIAGAVATAHLAGVFHRDLKPGNVLVGSDGRPRITDFGLASRAAIDLSSSATLAGKVVGSPSYLPPELAAGRQNCSGEAVDVYGLGAILYHLITGRAPFAGATAKETLRLVLETEAVAPRLLNPSLPRDLETICLKCLGKEAAKRYATAADVAMDLKRFLEKLPIQARPPHRRYRAWKFLQRHRSGVAATAVAFLALVVGLTLALIGFRRAVVQRRAADGARNQAQQMITFIMDDLQPALQSYGRVDAMTESAEMAVRYFENLPLHLRGEDTLRAHAKALEVLFSARGGTRGNFLRNESTDAWKAIEQALALRRQVAAIHPDSPEAAAAVLEDENLLTTGRLPAAEMDIWNQDIIRKYHDLERRFPESTPVKRGLQMALQERSFRAGREFGKPAEGLAAGAENCARLKQRLEQAKGDPTALLDYASGLAGWAHATRYAGNLEEALKLGEQAVATARSALEVDPVNHRILASTAIIASQLVFTHWDLGDDQVLETAWAARRYFQTLITFDPANPEWRTTDALLAFMEGFAYLEDHRLPEARTAFRESVVNLESGPSGPASSGFLMQALAGTGIAAAMAGDMAEAQAHLEAVRERCAPVPLAPPEDSLEGVLARFHWLYQQSRVINCMQAWPELERIARGMIETTELGRLRFPGSEFELARRRATAHACLGRALLRQGKPGESVPFLERAETGFRDAPPGGSFSELPRRQITEASEDLAEALALTGRNEQARNRFEVVLAQRESDLVCSGSSVGSRVAAARAAWLLSQTMDRGNPKHAARRTVLLARAMDLLSGPEVDERLTNEDKKLRAVIGAAKTSVVE